MHLAILGLVLASLQNSAIQPIPVQSPDWINRHNAMVRVAEKGKSQLVFIGDSITHAFGGSQIRENRSATVARIRGTYITVPISRLTLGSAAIELKTYSGASTTVRWEHAIPRSL